MPEAQSCDALREVKRQRVRRRAEARRLSGAKALMQFRICER